MKDSTIITLGTQALITALKIAGPILLASLVVGLLVSIFQSITQIQDFTLTFIPKLAAIAIVIFISGHFMLGTFENFTLHLYRQIPHLISSG